MEWEADGVLYSFSGRGMVSRESLIKMAESIK
ncbi:hypothetical protein [Alkaliphilus crotonatoxidans]